MVAGVASDILSSMLRGIAHDKTPLAREVGLPLGPKWSSNFDTINKALRTAMTDPAYGAFELSGTSSPVGHSPVLGTSLQPYSVNVDATPRPSAYQTMDPQNPEVYTKKYLDSLGISRIGREEEDLPGLMFQHSHPFDLPNAAFPLSNQDLLASSVRGMNGISSLEPNGGLGAAVFADSPEAQKFTSILRNNDINAFMINDLMNLGFEATAGKPSPTYKLPGQQSSHALGVNAGMALGLGQALKNNNVLSHYSYTPGNERVLKDVTSIAPQVSEVSRLTTTRLRELLAMLGFVGSASPLLLATETEEPSLAL